MDGSFVFHHRCIGIHVALGNARDVPFFISEADYPGLERFVFTIGLFVSAVFHFMLTLRLYTLFKDIARRKLLRAAMILGIASSTHLAILAFADMYDHLALHVYTSLVVFHGGFTWAILAHFSLPHPNKTGRAVRLVSLFTAFVSLATMTIAMSRGIEEQRRVYDIQPEMIPLDDLQLWIDVALRQNSSCSFLCLDALHRFHGTSSITPTRPRIRRSRLERATVRGSIPLVPTVFHTETIISRCERR